MTSQSLPKAAVVPCFASAWMNLELITHPSQPLRSSHPPPPHSALGHLKSPATAPVPRSQNWHQDSEATSNHQISLEPYASCVYLSLFYYFDLCDVALSNFAKYFLHQSHEVREHAETLMKLQKQRSGQIFSQDTKDSDHDNWENGPNITEYALHLEKSVNLPLLDLHTLATDKDDPNMCDFIETHDLNEQVNPSKNWVNL